LPLRCHPAARAKLELSFSMAKVPGKRSDRQDDVSFLKTFTAGAPGSWMVRIDGEVVGWLTAGAAAGSRAPHRHLRGTPATAARGTGSGALLRRLHPAS